MSLAHLVHLVYLVCSVTLACLVYLVEPDEPNQPDEPIKPNNDPIMGGITDEGKPTNAILRFTNDVLRD